MMTQKDVPKDDVHDHSNEADTNIGNADLSEWSLGKLMSKSNETEKDIEVMLRRLTVHVLGFCQKSSGHKS